MPPFILSESIQGKSCTNKYIGKLSKKRSNLEGSYKLKKKYVVLLERNKIEGTPILKLAMVKRLKVKKKISEKNCHKNSSQKFNAKNS